MTNTSHFKTNTLREQIVSGSLILLSGSALTTVINLAYNIVVARSIGPRGFGQTTAVYTLLIILSAVTLSFQIVSAKTVAQQSSVDEKAAVYRTLHRSAWACGLLIALLVLLFRDAIAAYFQLPASVLVSLLALGTAFYIPLGSRRGYIQGTCSFYRLAFNLVIEGAVRLGGSWAALQLGYGVRGVVAANAIAIAIAYLAIAPRLGARIASPLDLLHALRETLQAIVFFSGQVLINNSDIVLVKHFFPATLAGIYAAVAMVGRVIFAFSSAVVNSTFPLVAGTRDEQRKDLRVIATSLLLVLVTGGSTALGLLITPDSIWTLLFGPGFAIAGPYDVSLLLALYALTTVIYSLSAVIITYEMSYKIANASWVQLAFSIALILGICYFHSSLQAVIAVQLILMMMLLAFISVPFLISSLTDPKELLTSGTFCAVRTVRRVSEDEVIAEFLKSDFHYPAFQEYRDSMQAIVAKPNFDDASENAKRRALLYIRHLSLWKELPSDTEWYEAELTADDLINIRAFPRAQWRKPARGSFSITEIVEGVRGHHDVIDEQSLIKINDISHRLSKGTACLGTLILIGLNESEPLTVLDGNHRLVAALLASPKELNKLRFMCGLSPRMMECCWYNTNLATLFRYGKNMLMNFVRKPKAELVRLLQDIS
ncbi:MAG TPA: lipopolysaccharide biosynthesis protein [Terracidiphilus sp.]|nr:lipopolysaccharide biosynthesis protein [Terracidiphilus sp.]